MPETCPSYGCALPFEDKKALRSHLKLDHGWSEHDAKKFAGEE